jgi:hypothetical protein
MPGISDSKALEMSSTDAAWLAGFIDGEGSIVSYIGGKYDSVCWRISVCNTDTDAIEKCAAVTGTGKIKKASEPKNDRHKQQWYWIVNAKRDIHAILNQIRPYTVIKSDKIDEFNSTYSPTYSRLKKQLNG